MALELVYTSATRGLRPGTSGFCTVAMTRGFPPALVPRLEALGGYRPGTSGDGPVARCFWRVETATGVAHVLASVGPAPPDHTARSNKIACYLVLSPDELVPAGPAWLLSQPGLLRSSWSGAPAWIDRQVAVPAGAEPAARPCGAWAAAAGDAGWAGVLASAFLRDQSRPAHVIYREHLDPLPLVDDALGLLPDWARWRASFSTYFLQPVAGTPCAWRFCLEGTPAADAARQSKGLVIDLTRQPGMAPDSRFARRARTGIDDEAEAAPRRRSAARRAGGTQDAPLELEPDLDPGAPARSAVASARRALPAEEPAVAEERSPVKPVVIAVAAGALTLVLLLVLVLLTSTGGSGGSPAPESAEPVPDSVPGPASAPAPELPPLELRPERPASVPPPADAPVSPPATAAAPAVVASTPPDSPVPGSAAGVVSARAPVPAPPPEPAPVPDGPVAGSAGDAASAALPEPARWTLRLEPAADSGGIQRTRGRVDLPSETRSFRFVVPASLRDVGVRPSAAGDRIDFGGAPLRAGARLDGGALVVETSASGPVPEALAASPARRPPDVGSALARILDRCTIEVLGPGDTPIGRAQLRTRISTPIVAATAGGAAMPAAVDAEVGAGPVAVQVVAPPKARQEPPVIVADRTRRELAIGGGVVLSVDRSVVPSSVRVNAVAPSAAELAKRRAALASRANELEALRNACEAVGAFARGKPRPEDFDLRYRTVEAALTEPERSQLLGPARDVAVTDPGTLNAMLRIVLPRTVAARDAVTAELKEANDAAAGVQRRRIRIWTEDGIVVLDADVVASRGGKP